MPALSPVPDQRSAPPAPDVGRRHECADAAAVGFAADAHVDTPKAPAPQIARRRTAWCGPSAKRRSGLHAEVSGIPWTVSAAGCAAAVSAGDQTRLQGLIRDGKLYLTLQDAIALALENNLDVEAERYNLVLAQDGSVRAAGGGNLRGIDYSIAGAPNGVGGPGSPLLNAETTNTNPITPTVTD